MRNPIQKEIESMEQKIAVGNVGSYTVVKICAVDKDRQETLLGYGVLSSDGFLVKGNNGRYIFNGYVPARE